MIENADLVHWASKWQSSTLNPGLSDFTFHNFNYFSVSRQVLEGLKYMLSLMCRVGKVTAERRSHNYFTVNNSRNSDVLNLLWYSRVSNLHSAVWKLAFSMPALVLCFKDSMPKALLNSRYTDFHRRAYVLSFMLCALEWYLSTQVGPHSSSQGIIPVELISSFFVCIFFLAIKDQASHLPLSLESPGILSETLVGKSHSYNSG